MGCDRQAEAVWDTPQGSLCAKCYSCVLRERQKCAGCRAVTRTWLYMGGSVLCRNCYADGLSKFIARLAR